MSGIVPINVRFPVEWNMSDKGGNAVEKIGRRQQLHGIISGVPIKCKGDGCPYKDTCDLLPANEAPIGERCPIEVAMFMSLFQGYMVSLDIEATDLVSISLLKDLCDVELQIARCDRKIAEFGDFEEMIAVGATKDGDLIEAPALRKANEYKELLQAKKFKIMHMFNATREDKAKTKEGSISISQLLDRLSTPVEAEGQIVDVDEEKIKQYQVEAKEAVGTAVVEELDELDLELRELDEPHGRN